MSSRSTPPSETLQQYKICIFISQAYAPFIVRLGWLNSTILTAYPILTKMMMVSPLINTILFTIFSSGFRTRFWGVKFLHFSRFGRTRTVLLFGKVADFRSLSFRVINRNTKSSKVEYEFGTHTVRIWKLSFQSMSFDTLWFSLF